MTRPVDEYREKAIAHVIALSKIDPQTGAAIAPTREEYETTRPPGAPAYSTLRLRGIPWASILHAAGLQMQGPGAKPEHYPAPTPEQIATGIITGDPQADAAIRHILKIATRTKTGELIPPTRQKYERTRPPEAPSNGTLRYHGWSWARLMRAAGMQPRPRGGDRNTHGHAAQPIPAPVTIVTGNITSDEQPQGEQQTAVRMPAEIAAEAQAAADAAGISRNKWIAAAIEAKTTRRRTRPPAEIDQPRNTQISLRIAPELMQQAKHLASRADQTLAAWILAAIVEALDARSEIDPLTHPDYAHLPQPQRDPITGELIPPRNADGLPIWRVSVSAATERTCRSCGEVFTPRRDTMGRQIGACPICGDSFLDEHGERRATQQQPSVPTISYLRPGEYQIAAAQARR